MEAHNSNKEKHIAFIRPAVNLYSNQIYYFSYLLRAKSKPLNATDLFGDKSSFLLSPMAYKQNAGLNQARHFYVHNQRLSKNTVLDANGKAIGCQSITWLPGDIGR